METFIVMYVSYLMAGSGLVFDTEIEVTGWDSLEACEQSVTAMEWSLPEGVTMFDATCVEETEA